MKRKENAKDTVESNGPKVKGKPGRKPMSLEEKQEAAKVRAAEKEKALNLKPEVYIQFHDGETDIKTLVEAAKTEFHQTKKRTLVTDLKLYIKPEEHTAYYVINGDFTGKVPF